MKKCLLFVPSSKVKPNILALSPGFSIAAFLITRLPFFSSREPMTARIRGEMRWPVRSSAIAAGMFLSPGRSNGVSTRTPASFMLDYANFVAACAHRLDLQDYGCRDCRATGVLRRQTEQCALCVASSQLVPEYDLRCVRAGRRTDLLGDRECAVKIGPLIDQSLRRDRFILANLDVPARNGRWNCSEGTGSGVHGVKRGLGHGLVTRFSVSHKPLAHGFLLRCALGQFLALAGLVEFVHNLGANFVAVRVEVAPLFIGYVGHVNTGLCSYLQSGTCLSTFPRRRHQDHACRSSS